jgi:hypothetical protein
MRARLSCLFAVMALLGFAGALVADQPPVSVVMDSRGFVYYSDLENVWRISPTGARAPAVIGVHTHQLYVDPQDRLYGEDATNDPATGQPYHRVWRLDPDGTLTDVIPLRPGYLWDYGDFGFVHDRMGVAYLLQRTGGAALLRLGESGKVSRVTLPRSEPGFALPTPDGRVLVTSGLDLIRVDPRWQQAAVWKPDLADVTPRVVDVEDRQALLGLWLDPQARVYVACYAGAAVLRIDSDGEVSLVARSPDGWSPSGGMVGPDDSLWLLEMSEANEVRLRRLMSDGTERLY